jgi:phosphoribulokinase
MSKKHPVIAITGSSGAGTTTVKRAFEHIFRREKITPAVIEGDSFHRYNRMEMREAMKKAEAAGNRHFSHFGPEANLFEEIANCFRTYGETGGGRKRYYLHSDEEAAEHNKRLGSSLKAGEFTTWEDMPSGTDLLFYEGLHGGVVTEKVDVAKYVDLLVGVVPIVNLEWIQKIHRDTAERGYSTEAVVDTILRRMPDYMNYITPQFSRTHINFQRVPVVDTSNPFIARDIPNPDESLVVIRFRDPKGVDFPYYLSMIHDSFMSRPNNIVVPGGKMGFAMEVILTPLIEDLLEKKKKA